MSETRPVRIHFNHHAQLDPELVLAILQRDRVPALAAVLVRWKFL